MLGYAEGFMKPNLDRIADELLADRPLEVLPDHTVLANLLRQGALPIEILNHPACDRWPETYTWLRVELSQE